MRNPGQESDLQIVTTPSIDWLSQHAESCNSRMLIASPYVNDGILQLAGKVNSGLTRTLVTRTDLRDFAIGSSNLNTLCTLARDGFSIHSLSDLHAKIYIFDNSSALVTSANATYSGMNRNWECGFGTHNANVVTRLARSLMRGLGAERPPRKVSLRELEDMHVPLSLIKVTMPEPIEILEPAVNAPASDAKFTITDDEALLQGYRRWRRIALQGVLDMPKDGFRMEDLLPICAPLAARQYPNNNTVEAQLRRQLQILRDDGFVEFVNNRGLYRYTMKGNENK
jgi:hypothetical protein